METLKKYRIIGTKVQAAMKKIKEAEFGEYILYGEEDIAAIAILENMTEWQIEIGKGIEINKRNSDYIMSLYDMEKYQKAFTMDLCGFGEK